MKTTKPKYKKGQTLRYPYGFGDGSCKVIVTAVRVLYDIKDTTGYYEETDVHENQLRALKKGKRTKR